MTDANLARKPRPRRVAADEAHAWARNLRLHNSLAKLVLSMLTLYVDGDGVCFVGIPALAEDTELAPDTVRRRLGWLEGVGVLVRFPCWIDEAGRRNREERGRRTTDEIRLLLNSDPDEIERRAMGNPSSNDGDSSVADPSPQQGSAAAESSFDPSASARVSDNKNLPRDSISPLATPALRPGPNDSNLEPEHNPPTPLRGEGLPIGDQDSEAKPWPYAESWSKFESAWKEPILHQQLCRQIWAAFTDAEREMAIRVARGYVAWRTSQKRPPNACNAQKILRETDAWPRYAELAGSDPALRTFIAADSEAYAALTVLSTMMGVKPPKVFDQKNGVVGYWRWKPPTPDLIGLAVFKNDIDKKWTLIETDSVPFKAWASRIHEWIDFWPRKPLRVPCLYPPRKDGTIAPGSVPLASESDLQEFGQTG